MSQYINQIILTVLLAIAAFLGVQAKNLYRKYVDTDIKKAVVKDAVLFVEQVYKDIHGPEKLKIAMERASAILAEYGITISDTELVTMIESAVKEFINSFVTFTEVEPTTYGTFAEVKPTYGETVEDQE